MNSFVCFLWNTGYREYTAEHVNILALAIQRFYKEPHRFICVTDKTKGFCSAVEVLPIPAAANALAKIPSPHGKDFPSSYRRMWCFSEEAKILGDRIMLLDIDAMIVGDLEPLWAREADFVGWRPMSIWGKENRIGGGTWLLKTGKLTWLWKKFTANPGRLIEETKKLGWNGSDQAIMSRFLHKNYPTWPQMCGIYGSQDGVFHWDIPPKDAKIVHFNGDIKPWNEQKLWMRAYCNHFRKLASIESERKLEQSTEKEIASPSW